MNINFWSLIYVNAFTYIIYYLYELGMW
jgi:hypothetical protein